jgi:magnesium chelatase subunit I
MDRPGARTVRLDVTGNRPLFHNWQLTMTTGFRGPSPVIRCAMTSGRPSTLAELRAAVDAGQTPRRSVKDEIRENLIARLHSKQPVFPGIIGFEETVVPQIVNAILSRHNFILLGLRGQAKSRILRELAGLLDDAIPVVPGCEIHDDPLRPLCAVCRARVGTAGDDLPIAWLAREARYVEKLATPDVTIADMIGDLDPIKAARAGLQLSDELTMHYGLLPRANRGIFAINELPDLAGEIQVGLFNILQEGDVQIKGYPVRLPLDVLLVFSANPEDYTARGKIITPLKDRIGSEIRTHYPATRHHAMAITAQEAWVARRDDPGVAIPEFVREVVEEVAFQARQDSKIDKRSGVSQRLPISLLENVVSNAERRALLAGEASIVPRVTDVYAALPAITGKFELEYEGELRGADNVARDIIRAAVGNVFGGYFADADVRQVTEWFDLGGTLHVDDTLDARELLERTAPVQGLRDLTGHAGVQPDAAPPALASAVDFILEGLYAQKKITRSDEFQYQAAEQPRRPVRPAPAESGIERDIPMPGNKKKYYN